MYGKVPKWPFWGFLEKANQGIKGLFWKKMLKNGHFWVFQKKRVFWRFRGPPEFSPRPPGRGFGDLADPPKIHKPLKPHLAYILVGLFRILYIFRILCPF